MDKLEFKRLEVWGQHNLYGEQYKITSYVYKSIDRCFGYKETVSCPRYWRAYYVLPPYSWGDEIEKHTMFKTQEEAVAACQLHWERIGNEQPDLNTHGRKCYEKLKRKHSYENAAKSL